MEEIIYDYHVFEITVFNNSQILDEKSIFCLHAMLPRQNVIYVFIFWVYMINYRICIVLSRGGKDNDFKSLTHILKKLP